jgi:uncharacterized phage protein gp47/JayE
MSWTPPDPATLAGTAASIYEGLLDNPDARSPNSALGATCRVAAMAVYGVYLAQTQEARELWPDTAVDNLERLAEIKGLTRDAASAASFDATMTTTSVGAVTIPLNTQGTGTNGLTYETTAAVTIAAGGTGTLNWVCLTAGSAGTRAAGDTITLVSAIAGLQTQTATVISDSALTSGEDEETDDSLRARLLDAWRTDAAAGNAADWRKWVKAALPDATYIAVLPRWAGLGTVGLPIAMTGPRAPTSAELATILAYASDTSRCPVCSVPYPFAAPLVAVPVTLHLNPDTSSTRAAAKTALISFFLQDGSICDPNVADSGLIAISRLDAALSAGDGEWEHTRSAPTADVQVATGSMPVLGTVTFT